MNPVSNFWLHRCVGPPAEQLYKAVIDAVIAGDADTVFRSPARHRKTAAVPIPATVRSSVPFWTATDALRLRRDAAAVSEVVKLKGSSDFRLMPACRGPQFRPVSVSPRRLFQCKRAFAVD